MQYSNFMNALDVILTAIFSSVVLCNVLYILCLYYIIYSLNNSYFLLQRTSRVCTSSCQIPLVFQFFSLGGRCCQQYWLSSYIICRSCLSMVLEYSTNPCIRQRTFIPHFNWNLFDFRCFVLILHQTNRCSLWGKVRWQTTNWNC